MHPDDPDRIDMSSENLNPLLDYLTKNIVPEFQRRTRPPGNGTPEGGSCPGGVQGMGLVRSGESGQGDLDLFGGDHLVWGRSTGWLGSGRKVGPPNGPSENLALCAAKSNPSRHSGRFRGKLVDHCLARQLRWSNSTPQPTNTRYGDVPESLQQMGSHWRPGPRWKLLVYPAAWGRSCGQAGTWNRKDDQISCHDPAGVNLMASKSTAQEIYGLPSLRDTKWGRSIEKPVNSLNLIRPLRELDPVESKWIPKASCG